MDSSKFFLSIILLAVLVIPSISATDITTCTQLQNMNQTGSHRLMNNINCSNTTNWNIYGGNCYLNFIGDEAGCNAQIGCVWNPDQSECGPAKGWQPIATFNGTLDGKGYNISNLYFSRDMYGEAGNDGSAIFNYIYGEIKNLSIVNPSFTAKESMAVLGFINYGNIQDVSVIGGSLLSGGHNNDKYGLVYGNYGTISRTRTSIDISSDSSKISGMVGINYGNIDNCYTTGALISPSEAGGIAGINAGNITNSYSTGSVTISTIFAGGLVAENSGYIINSFTTSNVTGGLFFDGALAGTNSGTITNSYWNNHTGTPSNCYFGGNTGCTAINNNESYFKVDIKSRPPFSSWDFVTIWDVGSDYPFLNPRSSPKTDKEEFRDSTIRSLIIPLGIIVVIALLAMLGYALTKFLGNTEGIQSSWGLGIVEIISIIVGAVIAIGIGIFVIAGVLS